MIHASIGQDAVPAIIHDGAVLTLDDLPPRYNRRWPAGLQARLLAAIAGRLLSEAEACARYKLKPADLAAWRAAEAQAAVVADASDTIGRLVSLLIHRGYLDASDAAYVNDPHSTPRLDAGFLVEDAPFDFR